MNQIWFTGTSVYAIHTLHILLQLMKWLWRYTV